MHTGALGAMLLVLLLRAVGAAQSEGPGLQEPPPGPTTPSSMRRDELERRHTTMPTAAGELVSLNGHLLGTVQWIATHEHTPRSLSAWCSLVANVQWIISGPNQVTEGTNRNVVVPGLRTLFLF